MKFPTLVYRCPGRHQCPGGTFDYCQAEDEGALAKFIKKGWYPTLPFAQSPKDFDLEGLLAEDRLSDNGLEVGVVEGLERKELEEKAHALGVQFDKRIKTKTLIERIKSITNAGSGPNGLD